MSTLCSQRRGEPTLTFNTSIHYRHAQVPGCTQPHQKVLGQMDEVRVVAVGLLEVRNVVTKPPLELWTRGRNQQIANHAGVRFGGRSAESVG